MNKIKVDKIQYAVQLDNIVIKNESLINNNFYTSTAGTLRKILFLF